MAQHVCLFHLIGHNLRLHFNHVSPVIQPIVRLLFCLLNLNRLTGCHLHILLSSSELHLGYVVIEIWLLWEFFTEALTQRQKLSLFREQFLSDKAIVPVLQWSRAMKQSHFCLKQILITCFGLIHFSSCSVILTTYVKCLSGCTDDQVWKEQHYTFISINVYIYGFNVYVRVYQFIYIWVLAGQWCNIFLFQFLKLGKQGDF